MLNRIAWSGCVCALVVATGCANNDHLNPPGGGASAGTGGTDVGAGGAPASDTNAGTETPASPTDNMGTTGSNETPEVDAGPAGPAWEPRPIWTCKAMQDDGSGLASNMICADFPEATGWTESTAQAACDAINGENEFGVADDCDTACIATASNTSARCQDPSDEGVSFRYDQTACGGFGYWIGELFGAPADDPDMGGPFGCYNDGCALAPADDDVITCRYASQFVAENCADFPMSEGWTEAEVDMHCAMQQGADAATVVVTTADSCLAAVGGTGGAARCMTRTGGKAWAAYGAPQAICEGFIGDEGERMHQEGPFCDPYQ